MRAFITVLLTTLGLVAVVFIGSSVAGMHDFGGYDPVQAARQEAQIAAIERRAALDAIIGPAFQIVLFLAFCALVCIALYYFAAVVGAAAARFRYERRPDARGLLPVGVAELQRSAPAALAAYHATQHAAASRQAVPASLTYSPHYSRIDPDRTVGTLVAEPAASAPALVPTFADLLAQRRIGKGQPLLLGFDRDTGSELVGSWLDLYATATAGLPGSGKTTSQRFFAAQTALHGARFVVCDPHAGAADDSLAATLEPLRSIYLCDPAEDPRRILEAVQYVAHLGEERVSGRSRETTPIILWLDELTGLLGRSDVGNDLAELLEKIAQEYRKRYVYLSASGQIWTAARTSSELRDSLASVLCHRMKRSQARLLLPTEEAAQAERLQTGEAVLWRTNGATAIVTIPNTTAGDVRSVAGMLGDHQATGDRVIRLPTEAWRKPGGSLAEARTEQATTASGRAGGISAEAQRAAALFLGGSDLAAVVYALRGVRSSEGRRYQTALAEVQALIRTALSGQVGGCGEEGTHRG
jgi:hypothetical protein